MGPESQRAIERGLTAAEWYHTEVPRAVMKELMQRSDGPAIRDNLLWLGLIAATGIGGIVFWGTWWCVPFFLVYGVLPAQDPGADRQTLSRGSAAWTYP